jgi:uncharacterized protein DUF4129
MHAFAVDPDRARDDARSILQDRRFRSSPAPRPLRRPLEWLGDRLRDLGRFVARAVHDIPGPSWLAAAALVLALAALLVGWLVRMHRTSGSGVFADGGGGGRAAREDPDRLERQADAAERDGQFDIALRLRFRAGLLRLDRRGVIRYRPSLTTNEVRRALGSTTFDELAARFEAVTYGDASAAPDDVVAARTNWPRVVEDATRR